MSVPVMPSFIKPPSYDYEVEATELSDFITKHYDKPYNVLEELRDTQGNGSYQEYEVDGMLDQDDPDHPDDPIIIDGWHKSEVHQKLNEWRKLRVDPDDYMFSRNHHLPLEIVLWDLCVHGVIPKGRYMIKMDW